MIVCFAFRGGQVEYEFGTCRVPANDELVFADGSDPDFPQGTYEVVGVKFDVVLRGPKRVRCNLRRLCGG